MKQILQFNEADPILKPYYEKLVKCLDLSMGDCNTMCDTFSQEFPSTFKARTKGSFFSDRFRVHATNEFGSDPNVRFVEIRGAFGIVIGEKLVIRFNKMDRKMQVSINKYTKTSKKYINQIPMPGIEDLTYVWGGFTPDKIWSSISGYFLTCVNGNLNWHYDIGKHQSLQQLTIEIPTKQKTKRVTPKKKKGGDEIGKTGTND